MNKNAKAEHKSDRAENTQSFKKIGIAAVAAAAHALKPREPKKACEKDTPPVLLQEHWVI